MVRLPLELTYSDDNGLQGSLSSLWVDVTTFSAANALAQQVVDALRPLVTAKYERARFAYVLPVSGSVPASPSANLYERAGLLFKTGADYGLINIPSPNPTLYDQTGELQAIRISRARLVTLGLLAPLEAALAGFALPDGTPFPTDFIVGGRMGRL